MVEFEAPATCAVALGLKRCDFLSFAIGLKCNSESFKMPLYLNCYVSHSVLI